MEEFIRHPDLPCATALAGLDADALLLPAPSLPGQRAVCPAPEGTLLLLIESASANRAMLAAILNRLGYRVLAVADDQTALDVYAAHAEKISLVLFDYSLAEARAARIIGQSPISRALCLCRLPIDFLPPAQMRLLPRPCSLGEILTALNELLAVNDTASRAIGATRCPSVAS